MSSQRRLPRRAALAGLMVALVAGLLTGAEAVAAARNFRTAVVVLDYTDGKYGLTPARRAKLEKIHFSSTDDSLARYFEEVSDGSVTFGALSDQPTVLGPFEVGAVRTCDAYQIRGQAIAALAANGIPKTAYDAISVHHKRLYSCNWGGVGWTQDGIKTTVYGDDAGAFVLKHEFGHAFGLPHMPSVVCTDTVVSCQGSGYRGSSPLGADNVGLSAPELRRLGWFRSQQLILSPAPGTYTLTPLHAPRGVAGTRILEIPRPNEPLNRLFVAYRAAGTADPDLRGVQLHRSGPTKASAYAQFTLIDPSPQTPTGKADTDLAVGQRITDPASGLVITTVSRDGNRAVVRITSVNG